MTDINKLFNNQEQWQKNRKSLTWPEKIHLVEKVLESVKKLRDAPILKADDKISNGRYANDLNPTKCIIPTQLKSLMS